MNQIRPNSDFDQSTRKDLYQFVIDKLENYYGNTGAYPVSGEDWDISEVRHFARSISFDHPRAIEEVIEMVVKGLSQYAVHTPHPSYFGLFNPRTSFASILGDWIAATFNPQMAAWSHAPFANEVEVHIIQEFGQRFGYPKESVDGTFCSGGAESNHTSIICAVNQAYPDFNQLGARSMTQHPRIYCSSESHHSLEKAARLIGLGSISVQSIPVGSDLKMNLEVLKETIAKDKAEGYRPIMVIGTAGTTGAGSIDDLEALYAIAKQENMWFHVDAAYGGAVIASDQYRSLLNGVEKSDSITLDLHKWFWVPMGGSIFLTSHKNILHQSYAIKTAYMPEDGDPNQVIDPYNHSVQWSRRFTGLKCFLPLAIHGWDGYAKVIDQQMKYGVLFRSMLHQAGWEVLNDSPLPIVCFTKASYQSNEMQTLVQQVIASGKAWLSVYPIHGRQTARVCFNNYLTGEEELEKLLKTINEYS